MTLATSRNYTQIARQYADDVIAGKIPACKWVKLAAKRQISDLEKYSGSRSTYVFDEAEASRVCKFIELLTHTKGELAGTRIKLEPWQVFILSTAFGWRRRSDGGRRFRRVYIEVPRGNGKALALDTEIPTPSGFRLMKDLKAGDYVFGTDGKPCKIVATTDVMTDRPCYEVEFSTGEVIVADACHQWVTDSRRDRDRLKGRGGKHAGPKPSVKTTEEIARTLWCRDDRNHRVKLAAPFDVPERLLPIHPYMLGLWLGDGVSTAARFTCDEKDVETIDRIRGMGYPVHKVKGSCAWSISDGRKGVRAGTFQNQLRHLGLIGNKHIPSEYLFASREQRLELLRGLMDTDGFISKGQGQCEFVQKNKQIAYDVYALIASLGMRPRIMEKEAAIAGKSCGVVYRVLFHAYKDVPVFKLARKLERMRERPAQRSLQDYRQIVRCDKIESVPVRCIEVDSPDHCYLATRGFIQTHNSSLSSGVALYCLVADREPGAEVYSFATTRDQAKIVFGDAKVMAEHNAPLRNQFGLQVLANALYVPTTNSTFQAKSAEGSTLDGLNTHLAVIDELHAHKTRAVYDVVETSLGKRRSSLLWCITTAGFDTSGICYEVRTMSTKVLEGTVSDETQFAIIYTIDEGDDWTTLDALEKANPNWGVSVRPEMITSLLKKAKALPSAINNFLTKHLNVWCSASSAWMDMPAWDANEVDAERSFYEGMPCYIGLDIGAKNDVTAKVLLFPYGNGYMTFADFYLPEAAVERSTNSQYRGWVEEGWITQSGGAMTDLSRIEEDIREDLSRYDVKGIAFDPWNALQLATSLSADGAPMIEYRNTVQNFSDPMKSLEALTQDKRISHDGNPVLRWMMSNVVAKLDAKDNIFPRKERYECKIDGVVALIMALGIATSGESEVNPFADIAESKAPCFFEW